MPATRVARSKITGTSGSGPRHGDSRRPTGTRQTKTVTVDLSVTRDIIGKDGVVVKAIQRMCRDGCRINRWDRDRVGGAACSAAWGSRGLRTLLRGDGANMVRHGR